VPDGEDALGLRLLGPHHRPHGHHRGLLAESPRVAAGLIYPLPEAIGRQLGGELAVEDRLDVGEDGGRVGLGLLVVVVGPAHTAVLPAQRHDAPLGQSSSVLGLAGRGHAGGPPERGHLAIPDEVQVPACHHNREGDAGSVVALVRLLDGVMGVDGGRQRVATVHRRRDLQCAEGLFSRDGQVQRAVPRCTGWVGDGDVGLQRGAHLALDTCAEGDAQCLPLDGEDRVCEQAAGCVGHTVDGHIGGVASVEGEQSEAGDDKG